MKKSIIISLVLLILVMQAPFALAETIKLDSEVLQIKQEELLELASEEKFEDLTEVMEKLVQNSLSKLEKVTLEEINIIDFEYQQNNALNIYYQIIDK